MKASPGDRLIVHGHRVGERDRSGEVVEVRGEDGAPPYVIRWDDGHQDLFCPESDAIIEHPSHPSNRPGW